MEKNYKAFGALDTMPLTNGKELIKDWLLWITNKREIEKREH